NKIEGAKGYPSDSRSRARKAATHSATSLCSRAEVLMDRGAMSFRTTNAPPSEFMHGCRLLWARPRPAGTGWSLPSLPEPSSLITLAIALAGLTLVVRINRERNTQSATARDRLQ